MSIFLCRLLACAFVGVALLAPARLHAIATTPPAETDRAVRFELTPLPAPPPEVGLLGAHGATLIGLAANQVRVLPPGAIDWREAGEWSATGRALALVSTAQGLIVVTGDRQVLRLAWSSDRLEITTLADTPRPTVSKSPLWPIRPARSRTRASVCWATRSCSRASTIFGRSTSSTPREAGACCRLRLSP